LGGLLRHESREVQVVAKHWHNIWKWVSIGSAVLAAANLFLATGAIWYHSDAVTEHQKDIDDWDRAEKEVAGEHPEDATYMVIDLNKVTDIH
jgi:uncharacterized membrane protein YukC